MRLVTLVVLLSLLGSPAWAQSVRWHPESGSLGLGQTSELSLVFDQCEPTEEIKLPPVPGLRFGAPSQSSETQIINTRLTRRFLLNYPVRPEQRGAIRIPAFEIATDRGPQTVPAVSYDVGDATVGPSGASLDSVASSRFSLPAEPVWAGEVFPLVYTLTVARRYHPNLASDVDWNPNPLSVEDWSKPETFDAVLNGETRTSVLYRARSYARTPGTITLNPATQLLDLATGTSTFGLFSRPNMERFAITTRPAELTVRPLPQPAPAGFTGAVGQFTLTSKVVPATASVGEPVTWTLELAGSGNWPDISNLPARTVSKDFRIVQPQPKRTSRGNALFDASLSEDAVLIPSQPGTYTLGPVTWSYFDPKAGEYKTLTTEKASITIVAPSSSPAGPSAMLQEPKAPDEPAPRPAPEPIPPPAALPGDPLLGKAAAWSPWSRGAGFAVALAAPWVALLAGWMWLALGRAQQTDPWRAQRDAHLRIGATLVALRTESALQERSTHLHAWRRDVAAIWPLTHAAPPPQAFLRDPAWVRLWREAEHALYSSAHTLPEDWVDRAEAALAARPPPAFSRLSLLHPRNLFPFFVLGLLLASPPPLAAEDAPGDAYRQGDFAAAEKQWRARLEQVPTDWIAHHNLALALAQQNRWGEAAGHASAAFAQHPSHPSVRWHLALMLDRANYTPAALTPFLHPTPLHRLAMGQSPAAWQGWLVVASALLAGAAAAALARVYGRPQRWLGPAAGGLAGVGFLLLVLALVSLRLYGPLRDPRTVLAWRTTSLRSIPTEADTSQKTSPLAAGNLARVDRTFLSWVRLEFSPGQTGWVRRDDLVPLWDYPR